MINSELQPVCLTHANGRISIMYVVTAEYSQVTGELIAERIANDETVKAELAKWADGGKDVMSWRFIDAADVPADRAYRNAWRDNGKQIHHDMEHARAIHLENIRAVRTEALGQLDKQWMRAMGQGDLKAAATVEASRQKLRDLPINLPLAGAATVEELKALWPEELQDARAI